MHGLYIDETKNRNFVLLGCLVPNKDAIRFRKLIKEFLLPGQRSVHFRNESNRRRRQIMSSLQNLDLKVIVASVAGSTTNMARSVALFQMVRMASKYGATRLVFELDSGALDMDNKTLSVISYESESKRPLPWDHLERHHEPLLWIADAVAWYLNRGGDWARMVRPMILETIEC